MWQGCEKLRGKSKKVSNSWWERRGETTMLHCVRLFSVFPVEVERVSVSEHELIIKVNNIIINTVLIQNSNTGIPSRRQVLLLTDVIKINNSFSLFSGGLQWVETLSL